MGVGFENTCTVSGKWNVSRSATGLYGGVYKIHKTTPIISSTTVSHQGTSHSAGSQSVIITAGSQPGVKVPIQWVANFRLRTCLHSLSPTTYFWEQLLSYWAPSHKDPERWLFASKHVAHILLYIFLIVFYSHCIYVIMTLPQKEIFCSEIHKIITSI